MTGSVYFISDGQGRFKIGFSTDTASRLLSLQTANAGSLELLGEIPGSIQVERSLHQHFKRWHLQGEWFAETAEALAEIGKVLADPPASEARITQLRRVRGSEQVAFSARLRGFFVARHPFKTCECVSSDLGVGRETVGKWLAGESLPRGEMIPLFMLRYGPDFLSAVMSPAPDWVVKASRLSRCDEIAAEIAAFEAERATILVLTADGDRIKVPVRKPHRPCVPRPGA